MQDTRLGRQGIFFLSSFFYGTQRESGRCSVLFGVLERAFSPFCLVGVFPGALPQAGMVCAFGACFEFVICLVGRRADK